MDIINKNNEYLKCVSKNCINNMKDYLKLVLNIIYKFKFELIKYKNGKIELEKITDEVYEIFVKILSLLLLNSSKKYLKCIYSNCIDLYYEFISESYKNVNIDSFSKIFSQQQIFGKDISSDINKLLKIKDEILKKPKFDIFYNNLTEILSIIIKLFKMAYKKNKQLIVMHIKSTIFKKFPKEVAIDNTIAFLDVLKSVYEDKDILKKIGTDNEYVIKVIQERFRNKKMIK